MCFEIETKYENEYFLTWRKRFSFFLQKWIAFLSLSLAMFKRRYSAFYACTRHLFVFAFMQMYIYVCVCIRMYEYYISKLYKHLCALTVEKVTTTRSSQKAAFFIKKFFFTYFDLAHTQLFNLFFLKYQIYSTRWRLLNKTICILIFYIFTLSKTQA